MINGGRMDSGLFKQKNVGAWWGAFRNLGSYVSFYLTIISFFVLLINTYLLGNMVVFSWLPLPMWTIILLVIIAVVVMLGVAMIFEHKYTLPSFMTYWNLQWWNHGNKLPGELAKIQEQLTRIETTLKELEDKKQ